MTPEDAKQWFLELSFIKKVGVSYLAFLIIGNIMELLVIATWSAQAKRRKVSIPRPFRGITTILPYGAATTLAATIALIVRYETHMIQYFVEKTNHTMFTYLLGRVLVVTVDPENIKAMLATNFKDFNLGTRYEMFFRLLGNGIFTLSGEGWKHSRTLLRPQFARDQISHLTSILAHVNTMMNRFDESYAKGEFVDLQELMHCLTLDTATEFLFGESTDTLAPAGSVKHTNPISGQEFAESFGYGQTALAYRFISGPLWRFVDGWSFRKHCDRCKKFVDYFVHKSLENPMEKDQVADKYVFINELTKETRDPVVIRDQAINILLAGRDTTASTMSFMATYLSRHKDVYAKLRAAVLEDFGTDSSNISFETLKRCKYLNNVMNETMRLHPIVAINFRNAIRDTTLPHGGGKDGKSPVFIPKGTTVLYSPWIMHHSKKYWGENAEEFNPDRWNDYKGHSWEFLPFNGGPRICLGQQFALTEIACTWVRLCQTYSEIEIDPTSVVAKTKNLGRQSQHQRLTISVNGGVPCKLHRAKE